MVKKKENKREIIDSSITEDGSSMSQSIIKWVGISVTILTIGGFIFGLGYWVAGIEYKVEIMNLNQKHNNEMYELRIQMNNQIQTIQNKYDILESNYNALKERKEENHGK